MTNSSEPKILLRGFNDQGIVEAQRILDDLGAGNPGNVDKILFDDSLTIIYDKEPALTRRNFDNRFEAGKYFNSLLMSYEGLIPDVERNRGLWTWLAFCWLDLLAPAQADGTRNIGEWRKWLLSSDRRHYRHLLATPYRIYRAHADDPSLVLMVLSGPVESPGNITEQIASRPDIVKSKNIMRALTHMYYRPALGSAEEDLKEGKVGGLKDGASTSAVRMGKVLGQFYLTWDMFAMNPQEIIKMLPAEFDKFKELS